MVAALGAAHESTKAMGVEVADLQESLGVMGTRVREWDRREQQWEKEKGQLKGSVEDEKAWSMRLAQAKEEVERAPHDFQGKFVDLEMSVTKGVAEAKGLKVKNRELVANNRSMMSYSKAAEKEIKERQKKLALLKKAKGESEFVPSGLEDVAAQQVVREKASDLEWQMKVVQKQM